MSSCNLASAINHDLSLVTTWLGAIFCGVWLLFVVYFLGRAQQRRADCLAVSRRNNYLIKAPHYAEGPPLVPMRVDPQSGIIGQHWGREEEVEGDTLWSDLENIKSYLRSSRS